MDETLKTLVVREFDAVKSRIDDLREDSLVRHRENVVRLERIETEVRQTNGRVTRHDEQIGTLFKRKVGVPLSELRWWWMLLAAGAVAAYWVLVQLLGFHK